MITRREFLGVACLVLGHRGSLFADDQTPFDEALALMKKRKLPGVALLLPEGEKERAALGKELDARLGFPDLHSTVAAFLLEAVWVCVPAKKVEAKEGENCVLLDDEGKRVAGAKIDFSDQKKFEKGVKDLLEGEGRLEKRAEKATTDEAKKALEEKDDAFFDKHRDDLISVIVNAIRAEKTDAAFKKHLEATVTSACYRNLEHAEKEMPYGVQWKLEIDNCPGCGMAGSWLEGRKFVEFLTK